MECIARCFVYDFLRGGKFGIASRVAQHLVPFWAKQNVPAQEFKSFISTKMTSKASSMGFFDNGFPQRTLRNV
jgi:hypothetical protein